MLYKHANKYLNYPNVSSEMEQFFLPQITRIFAEIISNILTTLSLFEGPS